MKKIYNLESLIALRREIHRHAELFFNEFETQKKIQEYLRLLSVPESSIKKCASTGLVVDINGKGPASGDKRIIAFRAELDALPVCEKESKLEYKSETGSSHLCGHDGHMACLLGGVSLFLEEIESVPSDRTLRLLFQPAEEFQGGAKRMVNEGALEGASEVWGMHNMPIDPPHKIYAKVGSMTSGSNALKVVVEGEGGHSSLKGILKDPILPLCKINLEVERVLNEEFKEANNKDLIFSLLKFSTSGAYNVIPNSASAEGCLRFYDSKLKDEFLNRFEKIIEEICAKHGTKGRLEVLHSYPIIVNNEKLFGELSRLTEVGQDHCPSKASEDFSEFANVVPGCFFIYSSGLVSGEIHKKGYNFNDEVIEPASKLWAKIMLDRLK